MAQIVIDSNSNLIQGDFDSATVNNRTKFQTSTPNANTGVYAVPNGSGTVAGFQATNNSNPTNASKIVMATNGSTDTQIISGVNGSGTYLPLSFYTNNAFAMTIDTSQNVGIGTTSPSKKLHVYRNDTGQDAQIQIEQAGSGSPTLGFLETGVYAWLIGQYGADNSFRIAASGADLNTSPRLVIDSSGGVSIGATATYLGTEKFSVTATAAGWPMSLYASGSAANGMYIKYSTTPNSTGAEFFYYTDATAVRAYMRSNGGLSNYSANNTNLSDQREKTNIELAGSYLDKICSIPVKTFNYIDQNMEEDDGLTLGVIAQDVQIVAPELVTESNWGTKEEPKERLSIYQTDLQYALMKCIQEQQTIINDLTARITALEGASQ
jgi:hypothetical protein